MPKKRVLSPLPLLDLQLEEYMKEEGVKTKHADRIWHHVLVKERKHWGATPPAWDLQDLIHLPEVLYTTVPEKFALLTSKVVEEKTSSDGSTTKLLVQLQDGQCVESVIMRHQSRTTLCVSSQIGCKMGCTFCATGTLGELGNLTMGEICEQLVHANRVTPIRNVVFMGQGEPMNNFDNVLAAIGMMTNPRYFSLGQDKICISTVGVVPRMLQLTREYPAVKLALSLHAPNQDLREKIVPSARAYPMDRLMAALDDYLTKTGNKVMVEYVLLDGVNTSTKEAHELGQLLQGKAVNVNLIPYNPTDVGVQFEAPHPDTTADFVHIVSEEYGLFTTVRVEHGQDVAAACGQLSVAKHEGPTGEKMTLDDFAQASNLSCGESKEGGKSSEIEDLGKEDAPLKNKNIARYRYRKPATAWKKWSTAARSDAGSEYSFDGASVASGETASTLAEIDEDGVLITEVAAREGLSVEEFLKQGGARGARARKKAREAKEAEEAQAKDTLDKSNAAGTTTLSSKSSSVLPHVFLFVAVLALAAALGYVVFDFIQ